MSEQQTGEEGKSVDFLKGFAQLQGIYLEDISVCVNESGEPSLRYVHGGRVSKGTALLVAQIATTYAEIAPTAQESAHERGLWCNEPDCKACNAEKREEAIRRAFNRLWRTSVRQGVIYLVTDGERHKIGATEDYQKRKKSLRREAGKPVTLLATIHSNDIFADEKRWLIHFFDYHLKGEWFKLSPEAIEEFRAAGDAE